MGDFMKEDDDYISSLFDLMNLRFAVGDAIKEMVALQKEFQIFKPKGSFKNSVALLNLGGFWNWRVRKRWYSLLENLKNCPSDEEGQNGNDRIVAALAEHLASRDALPVYFTAHDSRKDKRVIVKDGAKPIFYIEQEYMTISLPMRPRSR
jgi:hypothetical protein